MDWKIFVATFGAIFLAELADKTQIIGINLAAKSGKPVSVWLGSVAAYMIVTLITVLIGSALSKFINPEVMKYAGGVIFIVLGILMMIGKL